MDFSNGNDLYVLSWSYRPCHTSRAWLKKDFMAATAVYITPVAVKTWTANHAPLLLLQPINCRVLPCFHGIIPIAYW